MSTDTVPQKSPKSLRRILEEKLLTKTQAELAKELGVSQQWVHQHVTRNGHKTVQPRKFQSVAKGLGMTVEELARLARRRNTKSF
jgi:hypothetical protein